MKKALYFLLTLLTFGIIIEACDLTGTGSTNTEFEISDLKLSVGHLIQNGSYFYLDQVDSISPDYTFDKESFGLAINIDGFNWTSQRHAAPVSLFTAAYADPIPPRSKYNPALISIHSDSAVVVNDTTYAATTSLTNLFEGYHGYAGWQPVLKILENFDEWSDYEPILLRFKNIPDKPLNQKILIKVTMENGAEFYLNTPTIKTE